MGRATAHLLARAGSDVGVVDLLAERADTVAGEIRELGRRSEAIAADVTDEAQAQEIIDRATDALGDLDILVNIVGMASWGALLDIDEKTWDQDQTLNLKQHFFVSRSAARRMISQGRGGSIAMVASVSAMFGAPNHGAYGAAKAGLIALTRTMAEEWFEHGIRVNSVAPGAVRTPRIIAQQEAGEAPSGGEAARLCEVEDIGGALLFLSSGLARAITGQTLVVDTGKTTLFPFVVS